MSGARRRRHSLARALDLVVALGFLALGLTSARLGWSAAAAGYAGLALLACVMGSLRRRWAQTVAALLALCFLLPLSAGIAACEISFLTEAPKGGGAAPAEERYRPSPVSDGRGRTLSGGFYLPETDQPRALVVFAHGIGGSHRGYQGLIRTLTAWGYLVYAYDATGHGETGGRSCHGLPQGAIDLERALEHVRDSDMARGLPLVLMGHSWGAYSACAVLNAQPEVDAVVALAGFDDPLTMIEATGRGAVGGAIRLLMPDIALWQALRFGCTAFFRSQDGLARTKAPVMIVQGLADTTVPPSLGYDRYVERFGGDARFTFAAYEGRRHTDLFDGTVSEAILKFLTQALDTASPMLPAAP